MAAGIPLTDRTHPVNLCPSDDISIDTYFIVAAQCILLLFSVRVGYLSMGGSPKLPSPTAGEQKGRVAADPDWPFAS